MAYFREIPYTTLSQLNLDWLIKGLQNLETEIGNFVALNTIKYANPFDWNITTQYAMNTLAFNPADYTAYLSVKPVPSGVQIDNTDYWTPVFTLKDVLTAYRDAITPVFEQAGSPATTTIEKGQLFWIESGIYYATAKINQGDTVAIGTNCAATNISAKLLELLNDISSEADAREAADSALDEKIVAETAARKTADSALDEKIVAETAARETADSEIINSIAYTYVSVKKYGAKGDGTTDDTNSINSALENSGCVYFPKGTYIISAPILLNDGQSIIGDGPGNTIIKAANGFSGNAVVSTKKFNQINNIDNGDANAGFNTIQNITIDGSAWSPYYMPSTQSGNVNPFVQCGGIYLAGTGFIIDNVKIFNCYTSGIYLNRQQTENWNVPLNAISKFSNIDIGTCGQHAIHLTGNTNTDTQWVNMHVANGSCSNNNTYFNLLIENGANGKFTNCHFASQYGYKKTKYSVCLSRTASGCVFSNCDIEGSLDSNLRIENNGNIFTNCRFYACFGNPGNNLSFSNSASENVFSACTFSGAASDNIFTGSFGWDIYGDGGGSAGSNSYNSFINCVTKNDKIAYFNSQWKNTIYIGTCTSNSSNFTYESQDTNRALITGGSNQQINI